MRSFLLTLAMGFTLSGVGLALPLEGVDSQDPGFLAFLSKRAIISPDNTCGNSFAGGNNSYSCDATKNAGGCCSPYGYCGNTTGMPRISITIYTTVHTNLSLSRLLRDWMSNSLWYLQRGNGSTVRQFILVRNK